MSNLKYKIGFLIYTYNRTDDAKINMEIIRTVWQESNLFSDIKIVHSYNGDKEWYPKKYLEDDLVCIKNPGHFQGAAELIDAGIKLFASKYPNVKYVIVVASDTWNVKPKYVYEILNKMKQKDYYWATCSWISCPDKDWTLLKGPAVDYFIVDLAWASKYKMFPLNYEDFSNKYSDFFYGQGEPVMLEKVILSRFFRANHRQTKNDAEFGAIGFSKIYIMKDREPVHTGKNEEGLLIRKMYWPKMGLITFHDPKSKREILRRLKITSGKNIKRLLTSNNLKYYNRGFISYQSGN